MWKLSLICISLILGCANAQQLEFKNCEEYKIIPVGDYGNLTFGKPLGYYEAVLPSKEETNAVQPCFEIKSATGKYIEIKAESPLGSARLCARDNKGSNAVCGAGTMVGCYMSPGEDVLFQFFCDQSCELSDVNFHYRFVLSETTATDTWCTERTPDDFPTSLIQVPTNLPPITTPKPTGKANSIVSSSAFLFIPFIAAYIL